MSKVSPTANFICHNLNRCTEIKEKRQEQGRILTEIFFPSTEEKEKEGGGRRKHGVQPRTADDNTRLKWGWGEPWTRSQDI